jgi:hypothetical protein
MTPGDSRFAIRIPTRWPPRWRSAGTPRILPIARDTFDHTRETIAQGMDADLLLLPAASRQTNTMS